MNIITTPLTQNQTPLSCGRQKKVAIFMALTIPATGKSTTFTYLCKHLPEYNLSIISSDDIRNRQMIELMGKNEGLEKGQAYKMCKQSADAEYFRTLEYQLEKICEREEEVFGIFMDKNYSCLTLDAAINHLKKITQPYENHLLIKIIPILPKCNKNLILPGSIHYPFSLSFIACCIKRVLLRSQHPTLEGTQSYRASVCLGWANNFRNLDIKKKVEIGDIGSIFPVYFTRQQDVPQKIEKYIVRIMLETPVGSFDEHTVMGELVEELKKWKYQEIQVSQKLGLIREEIQSLFKDFR